MKNNSISLQYVVYDADALVADIGGYLGLLLGHSIYSVLVTITGWLKNAKAFKARLRLGPFQSQKSDEGEMKNDLKEVHLLNAV